MALVPHRPGAVLVVLAAVASVAAFVGCSLLVDTGGLADGEALAPPPEAGASDAADARAVDAPADATVADVVEEPLPDGGCPRLGGPAPVRVKSGTVSFCIDSTEVTRAQYDAFLQSNPSTSGQGASCDWNDSFLPTAAWPYGAAQANLPVVGVDWCDARAFCRWAGKRLCKGIGGGDLDLEQATDHTRSEWAFACTHGGTRAFPYGNSYNGAACNGTDLGAGGMTPVGSMATCQGGFDGVFDMSGNAHEWIDACGPPADGGGPELDLCGGSGSAWSHTEPTMPCASREQLPRSGKNGEVSFRCCSP